MKIRKWSVWLTVMVAVVLMIAGFYAIAAEYGTQSDPLITLSYITDVLTPNTKKQVDAAVNEAQSAYEKQITGKVAEVEKYVDGKLSGIASGSVSDALVDQIADAVIEKMGTGSASAGWSLVKIPAGKTMICGLGSQAVLRLGSAVCVSSGTPGLIDLSDGTTLENGKSLVVNHLYAVSVAGRGISSKAGCTVLISGDYTIQ